MGHPELMMFLFILFIHVFTKTISAGPSSGAGAFSTRDGSRGHSSRRQSRRQVDRSTRFRQDFVTSRTFLGSDERLDVQHPGGAHHQPRGGEKEEEGHGEGGERGPGRQGGRLPRVK